MRTHFSRIDLVPHTHWDREWYLPFQTFRLALVRLIDNVLALLERDPRFVFTLDGQLQTVDDYLEVRPEREARIRELVGEGRLAIGPWQILMDEFLVSGETIWRNLELGLARAADFGSAMPIGYLPDQFGHVAQMPQILRAHGIGVAVVWRGVPRAIDKHRFEWRGPDGSAVRGEYLPGGYGNGASLCQVPDRFSAAVEALVEKMRPYFGDDPVLAMYGTDHMEPLPELVDLVERANANGDVQIRLRTLAQALGDGGTSTRRSWTGEMRSGARANLLMGVVSARMDIKQAAARAERALERYAEPFAALHGGAWPERELELAWRRMIENSAHDSICGCSADPVSAQVLVRFAEAEQIGTGLARAALAGAAHETPSDAYVVANPSPFARTGVVELEFAVPEEWDDVSLELPGGRRVAAQELERNTPQLERFELPGREIPELLRRLHGRELFGRWFNGFSVGPGPRLVLELDTEQDPLWLDLDQARLDIEAAAQAEADATWEVVLHITPRRRLAASVPVPALGWTAVRSASGRADVEHPVRADARSLDNGLVRVEVAADGTFSLGPIRGAGRIVRGKDVGDSYNYAPPPDDVLVAKPDDVRVETRAAGPVKGELAVVRTYTWDGEQVETPTTLELHAGEPFVRVRVAFDNRFDDQRVRCHVPLPERAERSFAEGQFAIVERGLEAEGGYGEVPLPTFPAHGFVTAGGLTALLEHVTEYEVVENELALTLLRSTGLISRNTNPYREDPAGPEVPIPDAQMHGPWSVGFGLLVAQSHRVALAELERYRLALFALAGSGGKDGDLREREGLRVEDAVLSALVRREARLVARLVNEGGEPRVAHVHGAVAELRPWEIRTLKLDL
jgi:alpha-mannosidase